ncbi:MAG: PBP1A family penicillin-binding protein [Heliobacteriaceae bacterium]|nr:PBP1A family penicillin-binding protein [Heliobacteriaceae bacterium]
MVPATSFVYDQNGQPVCQLHGPQHRIPLPLSRIPNHLQLAIIAAEDVRFFEHPGFDLYAIFRAIKTNYVAGEILEGASTIPQQLVKNLYLGPEKTWTRKFREIHLAYHLDHQLGKERILELYLNQIYFGQGAYGVESAARTYFAKPVKDLTLAECALLAGIPKNPGRYTPVCSMPAAIDRRNTVLDQMYAYRFITNDQWVAARQEPVRLNPEPPAREQPYPFPFFIDEILREAIEIHHLPEEKLFGGGLHIYTTLDRRVQSLAEELFLTGDYFPAPTTNRAVEAALACIDPYTGNVKAIVGGRSYVTRRGFNRATMMRRSPGSALKPLAVYAPAIEQGWQPDSLLPDEPLNFRGYQPKNYDGVYRGQVTIRQAIRQSINIPAVWLLDRIGVHRAVATLQALEIPVTNNDAHLSLALGGIEQGVSPLQLATGYGTLANEGTLVPTRAIIQVYDQNGQPLLKPAVKNQIFSPATAKVMTEMLQDTVMYGTAREAQLNRPVAGKTGTAELPALPMFEGIQGNRDAWFVGYTPELVTAVWMGYDYTDRENYLHRIYGGTYPARLFRAFMEQALAEIEPRACNEAEQN